MSRAPKDRKVRKKPEDTKRVHHDELVEHAGRWLRRKMGCTAVLLEASYGATGSTGETGEVPDAIGFIQSGGNPAYSVLVECKTTRQDYLKDQAKPFRQKDSYDQDSGMGVERYYLVPRGMVGQDELPYGWGLLEYAGGKISVARHPMLKAQTEGQLRQEVQLLVGALSLVQYQENKWMPRTDTKHSEHNLGPTGRSR